MDRRTSRTRVTPLKRWWQGQEGWYLLAAVLGVAGVIIAAGGLAPEFGLLTLVASCLCFGIGVLLHSMPTETQ